MSGGVCEQKGFAEHPDTDRRQKAYTAEKAKCYLATCNTRFTFALHKKQKTGVLRSALFSRRKRPSIRHLVGDALVWLADEAHTVWKEAWEACLSASNAAIIAAADDMLEAAQAAEAAAALTAALNGLALAPIVTMLGIHPRRRREADVTPGSSSSQDTVSAGSDTREETMSMLRARVHMVSAGLLESAANMTAAMESLAGQVEAAASQVQSYTESLAQLRLDGAQVTSFGLRADDSVERLTGDRALTGTQLSDIIRDAARTEAAEGARADQAGEADDQGRRAPAVTIERVQ
ncbi:hypothetical protein GGG16DRAFT_103626 [Schizophyllum commune]